MEPNKACMTSVGVIVYEDHRSEIGWSIKAQASRGLRRRANPALRRHMKLPTRLGATIGLPMNTRFKVCRIAQNVDCIALHFL